MLEHFSEIPARCTGGCHDGAPRADRQRYWHVYEKTSIVGQAEGFQETGSFNPNTNTANFAVGYTNIYWNNHPNVWVLVGGNTTHHGDNSYDHWMTTNAAYGIYYSSTDYQANHPS